MDVLELFLKYLIRRGFWGAVYAFCYVAYGHELDNALVKAAEENQTSEVVALLQKGADPNVGNAKGWTPLLFAAKAGNAEMTRALVKKGANVNARTTTKFGSPILCFACDGGNLEVFQILMDHGADIHIRAKNGLTPLNSAIDIGRLDLAKFLLDHGADPNRFSSRSSQNLLVSPLLWAAWKKDTAMMDLLLSRGANLEKKNNDGDTVLMTLAQENYAASLQFLISKGANVNARSTEGCTALMYAVYNRQLENIKLLIDAGADPSLGAFDDANFYGISAQKGPVATAMTYAMLSGDPEILALMKKAKAGNK